ncbi:MAG: thiolase family protein [Betaproteobacteria bacterium]|nr:thiolase family protein [Betaproteobacteria bacterium]
MRGNVVIAGIGHTAFGKCPGRTTFSLNIEACRNALADAGVEKDAVDALLVKPPTSNPAFMYGSTLAEAMGMQPRMGGSWDQGGAANISLISFAAMAIEHGQCEIALVCYADNPRTGSRHAYEKAWGDDAVYGWFGVPAGYAMLARRHMEEFGTTSDQLGEIAVAIRNHGAGNPNAQLRAPLTLEQYRESKWVVDPLRRDDCCLVSDGGAAVVLMSAKRAKAMGIRKAVPVLGFGHGQTSWDVAQRADLTHTAAEISGATAFKMAGLGPCDIDVAQIYDCFTITVLMTLEAYGFAKKGQGGAFAAGGRLAHSGELPINTSGSLLSETGMPGLQLVIEGVRQMRGEARLQVKNAEHCMVSNQGGIMHTHSTLILGQWQ